MNRNIAIIGSGQLGSRHLQALSNISRSWQVFISDPSDESLQIALARYLEVKQSDSPDVITCNNIDQLPNEIFMVVVATNSLVRCQVVEKLLTHAKVQYLVLEKFLFPSLEEFEKVEKLLSHHAVKTYVNTPRRMFDYFQSLKEKLKSPFDIQLSGTDWGLACNSVHYLDLMSFLAGDIGFRSVEFISDGKLYESKRSGYIEFCGSILVTDNEGNTGTFTCYREGSRPMLITISDPTASYLIKETGYSSLNMLRELEGKLTFLSQDIAVPRQSQLTHHLLHDFETNGKCILPEFHLSANIHKLVLTCFLNEYRRLRNDDTLTYCPIT